MLRESTGTGISESSLTGRYLSLPINKRQVSAFAPHRDVAGLHVLKYLSIDSRQEATMAKKPAHLTEVQAGASMRRFVNHSGNRFG